MSNGNATDIDLTADTSYLEALANNNHDHWKVRGEVIDDAFDAGASTITISFLKNKALSADNDVGCDRPSVMAGLGHRAAHKSTKLGRYGIGLKEAMFWWGGAAHRLGIRTTKGGITRL